MSLSISTGLDYIRRHTNFEAEIEEDIDLLHSFSALKKLSIKINTALPVSAACERLFSCGGLLFTSRRARLGGKHFENQLLLKLNKKFTQ